VLIDVAISGDRYIIKKKAEKILKRPYNINSAQVECESKSDTSNSTGKQTHRKTIQTMHQQHTGKARNQGTYTGRA
jgi:hypothetical protein